MTSLAEQAPLLLGHAAGYAAHRVIALGLRQGLVQALAEQPGASPDEIAKVLDLDAFYVAVWCRGAVAAGICDQIGDGYALAPHMATLLLDDASPAYAGGLFTVLELPEVFTRFEAELATGRRMWWKDTSPEWIAGVAGTGRPFYTRLIPGGLDQVPGLAERLAAGGRIVDAACGSGVGLLRLTAAFPRCTIVGVDGDAHSLSQAAAAIADAGAEDRVRLVHSALEDLMLDEPAALVVNNISMHECRDVDLATQRIREALEPGGWFVISDFPFPETTEALRSVPGRIMAGIQFFEAQIDDQLVPRTFYDELLARHGFAHIGSAELTAVHALTYGRRPPN